MQTTVRFISIDDHPSISDALRQTSERHDDVELVGAFRSIEAVPKPIREPGALADVAVLDLSLTGIGGLGGVDVVVGWGIAVVVFTATAHERVARQALDRGARGFVSKSLPTEDVLEAVRRASRGEVFMLGVEATPGPSVQLTPSEEQLVKLLASETRSGALAAEVGVSPATIDNRVSAIYDKIGLVGPHRTRARLSGWARGNGFA